MVFVFSSWLLIGISAFIWGIAFVDIFIKKDARFSLIMFCGLCALTVFSEFFSLFYKIGTLARLCVFLADVLLLIKNKKSILFNLKKIRDELSWQQVLWIAISCAVVLPLASSYIMNSDTYLYHAQSLRWITEFGVVKGIGDLHSRLAFDSSFLCLQALFGFEELYGQPMHSVNGFVAWLTLAYAGTSMKVWKAKKVFLSDGLRLGLVFMLSEISGDFSSPGTDLFAHCLTFYIFIEWVSGLEEETDPVELQIILSILSVYAMTLKLSAALLILFSVGPAVRLLKEKQTKKILYSVIAGVIILLPFCYRNIMISGYLIYPMEQLDFFNADWKMPAWASQYERLRTKAWAEEIFGVEELTAPFSTWFPYWFNAQAKETLWILGGDAFICVSGGVYYLLHGIRKHRWDMFLVYAIMSANLLYWFLSAPNVRFGRSIILVPVSLAFGCILSKAKSKKNQFIPIVLMCICMLFPFSSLFTSARAEERHFIRNVDYEEFDMIEYALKDVALFIPAEGSRNGYYEFPVVINKETAEKIELRGKTLREGFRVLNH